MSRTGTPVATLRAGLPALLVGPKTLLGLSVLLIVTGPLLAGATSTAPVATAPVVLSDALLLATARVAEPRTASAVVPAFGAVATAVVVAAVDHLGADGTHRDTTDRADGCSCRSDGPQLPSGRLGRLVGDSGRGLRRGVGHCRVLGHGTRVTTKAAGGGRCIVGRRDLCGRVAERVGRLVGRDGLVRLVRVVHVKLPCSGTPGACSVYDTLAGQGQRAA